MFVIELINLQILDFEIDFENDIFFLIMIIILNLILDLNFVFWILIEFQN